MEGECVWICVGIVCEGMCVCVARAENNCVLPCVKTINQVHLMFCHYG